VPLRINVVTIFPEFFTGPLGLSIPSRAAAAGSVTYNLVDLPIIDGLAMPSSDGTAADTARAELASRIRRFAA